MTRRTRFPLWTTGALLAAALLATPGARALDPADATLDGTWSVAASGPDGALIRLELDLRQEGPRVRGVARGVGGISDVHGRVVGERVWLATDRPTLAGKRTLKLSGRRRGSSLAGRVVTRPPRDRRARVHRPWVATRL